MVFIVFGARYHGYVGKGGFRAQPEALGSLAANTSSIYSNLGRRAGAAQSQGKENVHESEVGPELLCKRRKPC